MDKEPDLDKIIQDLIRDAKVKNAIEFVVTIIMCRTLLRKTKHDAILHTAAKKKVLATLEEMSIYKEYMKKLATEN